MWAAGSPAAVLVGGHTAEERKTLGDFPEARKAGEMQEQVTGWNDLREGMGKPRSEPQILRRLHEDKAMEPRSPRQILTEILERYGADERDIFMALSRAGLETGKLMTHREIGAACAERFGYAVTRQRVFSVLDRLLRRMSDEDIETLVAVSPFLCGTCSRYPPEEIEAREQKKRIGRMRRGAKTLKIPLNYADVLRHFGVNVPAKRDRTAALMGPEASMKALHEDFRMRAAAGWRICMVCHEPKREREYYVGASGTIAWCKDCNRTMARERYRKHRDTLAVAG